MPGDQMLGLTKATAFSESSNAQSIETENIHTQVQTFLADMEKVKDSLWGNAQVQFTGAVNQFILGYSELRRKLGLKAVALGEGNNFTVQTDTNIETGLAAVGKSIPVNINA
ncbi:hypothetical protein AB0I28_16610 [Phytomonospora sp. NPDC050363]|uniref:hypothetical protein n=1 Tax=Phytomonospora sp. NPDC050363 TaxID=3155642 RepID=UPI0033D85677